MAALKYWLWLTTRKGLGTHGVTQVLERFGSPEQAYFADPGEYDFLQPNVAAALRDRSMEAVERIMGDCDRLGVRIMTQQDADYPSRLHQLDDAPYVLYLKGTLPDFDEEVAIGVVGTRQATEYGKAVAGRLGLDLAGGGAIVVSGTAAGIDTCAVKGALQGGGTPVCVLGGGVDVPYPKENRYLYEDVAAAGLLISEYPPGTENLGSHFPTRNRIISGLSLGVVVVEAGEFGSGAVITANHALDQGRDVFAVPGNVDAKSSRGCNRLIQQGAKPVLGAEDILCEYRRLYPAKLTRKRPIGEEETAQRLQVVESPAEPVKPAAPTKSEPNKQRRSGQGLTDDELALLHALADKSLQADELVELTQIPARRVLSALTMLQIAGWIEERPGKRFATLAQLIE